MRQEVMIVAVVTDKEGMTKEKEEEEKKKRGQLI